MLVLNLVEVLRAVDVERESRASVRGLDDARVVLKQLLPCSAKVKG